MTAGPELRFLEGREREVALEQNWREWHSDRDREAHLELLRTLMRTTWARRRWRVPALVAADGRVLATAFLYELSFRLEAHRLRVAGIGSLCVQAELRGLGLGTRLMQALHELLGSEAWDAMALFSSIGPEWYQRLGYRALPTRVLGGRLGLPGARSFRPSPSVLRACLPADLGAVRNLYNTAAAMQRLALLREEDYWDHRLLREELVSALEPEGAHAARFLVGEREGRVVSYLRSALADGGETLVVVEYGFEPGAIEDLPALVGAALERLADRRPSRLRALVPTRFASQCPASGLRWRRIASPLLMVRPLGAAEIPSDGPQDERLVWASDRF